MKLKGAAFCLAIALLAANSVSAHRIDEYLQATILSISPDTVHASMRLIPGVLIAPAVISDIDVNRDGVLSEEEERAYAEHVLNDLTILSDGKTERPVLLKWSFPSTNDMRDGTGEIRIDYAVKVTSSGASRVFSLANHHLNDKSVYLVNALIPRDPTLHVTAQTRNEEQSLYQLNYEQIAPAPQASNALTSAFDSFGGPQFRTLFKLGMDHIAEGTDHLLFLLALLLPAPLLAAGSRWAAPATLRQSLLHILGVVTAFTVGHSISLSLAALGIVAVPERPVEILIAASIFVSAAHALRPIFPGRESWVAGLFGLVHGLAFGTVLERLGLGPSQIVGGILAFNLGIESMQLIVVAFVLPSLILLSRTRAYSPFRIVAAAFAICASAGWVFERLTGIATPVNRVLNGVAAHGVALALTLLLGSLAVRLLLTTLRWDTSLRAGRV